VEEKETRRRKYGAAPVNAFRANRARRAPIAAVAHQTSPVRPVAR
jgi:hypothetical protein